MLLRPDALRPAPPLASLSLYEGVEVGAVGLLLVYPEDDPLVVISGGPKTMPSRSAMPPEMIC